MAELLSRRTTDVPLAWTPTEAESVPLAPSPSVADGDTLSPGFTDAATPPLTGRPPEMPMEAEIFGLIPIEAEAFKPRLFDEIPVAEVLPEFEK